MVLQPKRLKHRKQFRGTMRGDATRGTEVSFGDFGLQSLGRAWITSRQIEAARVAMTRYTKRGGRVWIRIFPDKPITSKPSESSMGSGKGEVVEYVSVVKPGRMLYELGGVPEQEALEALRRAAAKLPIKTRIVKRGEDII
ncbi:MAG: 50S ribosomal protein L16 [bacterium]|nr:50S ribosomal protein L16 [bacterium]